jgi:hypothetical protein
MRKIEVRHLILVILDPIPGALPEPTLEIFLNLRIRPKAEADEFRETMDWLSSEKMIGSLPNSLDPDLKHWFITELGKVALRR